VKEDVPLLRGQEVGYGELALSRNQNHQEISQRPNEEGIPLSQGSECGAGISVTVFGESPLQSVPDPGASSVSELASE
jgi:hypothetical protein